uniref:WD repeat domain 73 n=1 Tax=Strix occidentalis caurina TaxID=311401 RepID=A0A8D0FBQ3_STROC
MSLLSQGTSARPRGNGLKLRQGRVRLALRKDFFAEGVVGRWNGLPRAGGESPSLEGLKSQADPALRDLVELGTVSVRFMGLCPERDFKVECGGFSNRPVYSLKHVPDTSLLVTSGPPDSSLQVWQVSAEDSDVIKSVSAISTENGTGQPWAKIATISARAPWVLHGSRLNNVQITEVESRKNVYMAGIQTNSEELSGLAFLDGNTLLLCCARGRLCLADVRQPQSPLEAASVPSAPCGERWCMGVGRGPQGSDSQPIACLSSGGHLTLTDVRKTSESLASAKCRVPSPSSGAEFLCVSWAPALAGCLAVSGFDGTVHVYDTQSWDSSGGEVEPIFVHKGHAFGPGSSRNPPLVTAHTWHPRKPRTLLSAASDGSLHVWDWVQSCGKCG